MSGRDMKTTRNVLAELIDNTREVNGWSDQAVANRAVAAGHPLSKANLSRVRNTPLKTLVPEQAEAIAAGLGLTLRTVVAAALETLGLPAGEASRSAETAIQADPSITAETKRVMLAMLKAARPGVTARTGELSPKISDGRHTQLPSLGPIGGTSLPDGQKTPPNVGETMPMDDDLVSSPDELGEVVVGDASSAARAHERSRDVRQAASAKTEVEIVAQVESDGSHVKRRRRGSAS